MLMGEYHHNIDEKGRIIIPSKFREDLGDKVIVTRGLEDCLFLYSENEWSQIVSKLKSLPFTKKDARSFTRIFLSGATVCEFDKQGSIKIIIGVNDRLEIWDINKWNSFFDDNRESLSDLADHLFESDFGD